LLRRIDGKRGEFIVLSLWDSLDAIKAFAGDDVEKAVFYPEDDAFLVVTNESSPSNDAGTRRKDRRRG
jgi:hypothetical protein